MNKRLNKQEVRNRINKLSEALLGQPEDISLEEAEELLRLAEFDIDSVSANLYRRLHKEAQQYWMASKSLPPLLKQALDNLRPLTEPPRNEQELGKQARARVERIVEDAKIFPVLSHRGGTQFQVSAFRNKKDLSTKGLSKKDQSLLDEIAEEMKNEVHRPGEEK
jgi:hypothetical protein